MQIKKSRLSILLIAFAWFVPSISVSQEIDPVLKELIGKGLSKSHSLNIHSLDAEQAKVDQKLAKSIFLPKVTFNGSYTRINDEITFDNDAQNLLVSTQKLLIKEAAGIQFNTAFPDEIPLKEIPSLQDKNILKSSADIDWVLFSGLEASYALKASEHKEASLNYIRMAERDKIVLKIIETYDKLALVYASKRVLLTSEKYLNEQAYYVKKAIENGLVTLIERKKIELAQQQLAAKQLEFDHNKSLLIEVLHLLTKESKERLSLLNPQLQPSPTNTLSSIKKRSEIKALEEAEIATLYKSKMENSKMIPKLALKGHYEFVEDDLSLLDPKWFVGIGVKWNVFDGNKSRLKGKKSVIEAQKYREQIEDTEEMIALSIIRAELAYEASLQNTKMVEKEVELTNDTYDMIKKQYKNDLASINELIEALNDLEKANFKLQESLFNQRRANIEQLHARGTLHY